MGAGASRWNARPPALAHILPGEVAVVSVERALTAADLGTAPGEATLSIEHTPRAAGPLRVPAVLRLDPDVPLIVPRNLYFAAVATGCASRPRAMRIHNTTNRALSGRLAQGPRSAPFVLKAERTDGPLAGMSIALAQGASGTVDVTSRPRADGARTAMVALGDPNLTIGLRGQGTSAVQTERFELLGPTTVDVLLVQRTAGHLGTRTGTCRCARSRTSCSGRVGASCSAARRTRRASWSARRWCRRHRARRRRRRHADAHASPRPD
jgi:hypothetical protein